MAVVKCPKCRKRYDPGSKNQDESPDQGRKVVCPACGQWARLPHGDAIPAPQVPPKTVKAMMSRAKLLDDENDPSPPTVAPRPRDDDDDGGAYGILQEKEAAAPVETKPDKKTKEKKAPVIRRKLKKKTIQYAEQWHKIHFALWLMFAGICLWGACWLLQLVMVMKGLLTPALYSPLLATATRDSGVDMATVAIGLLVGAENLDLGKVLYITEQALFLAAGGAFLGAYCICLGLPNVFGIRGQAITLIVLNIANLIVNLVLKLLPVAGVVGFGMMPLIAPETAFNVTNIERAIPLTVFWCGSPFWELFVAILLQALFFAEPILFCVLLRSTALGLKDDQWLEPRAQTLLRLGFGQYFTLLSFYLMSITGTSDVLGWTLLAIYFGWRCFLIGYIINFALVLWGSHARIDNMIAPDE